MVPWKVKKLRVAVCAYIDLLEATVHTAIDFIHSKLDLKRRMYCRECDVHRVFLLHTVSGYLHKIISKCVVAFFLLEGFLRVDVSLRHRSSL